LAITDLAAVRSECPLAWGSWGARGGDAEARAQWQTIVDHLTPYPTDATTYLPHEPPSSQVRNGENVACELIWPYGVTGIGAPDYDRALATWKKRPFPYGNVWANDAIQAARLGLGNDAYEGMRTMLQKYQSYPKGMTNNTNGVFEYLGVHLSVMNEALLQSYDDRIRVFPAMPSDQSFLGRFTLLAKGGFLVSSEKEGADIKYVGLESTLGGTAHLVNPWGSASVQVRNTADDSILATTTSAIIDAPTVKGGVYVVERVAKPLSAYTEAHIGGDRNSGAKHLDGTMCTLGL
jgi:alpha-L-fucosidase 2